MFLELFGLFLICSCWENQVLASLVTCPTATTPSMRYTIVLSSPMLGTYSGSLLLSSNGNFVSLFNIPDSGSPQSVVQGTWSFSDCNNSLALNTHTLYFLELPKLSIDSLKCTYTCGTDNNAIRSCDVTYTLKRLQASGSYPITLDLSDPE